MHGRVWLVGQSADLTADLTNAVRHGTRKPATGLNSEALCRTRTGDPLLTMEIHGPIVGSPAFMVLPETA